MTTYVALLRGINVGGNAKVPMARLKELFLAQGFTNVTTYINSGNVLFDTDKKDVLLLTGAIEHALKKEFGFPIPTLLRDEKTLRKVASLIPSTYTNDVTQRTDVLFLWGVFDRKSTLARLPANPAVDRVRYVPGAIVWNIHRSDLKQSGMKKFIGTDVYKHMTARNVNTVRKLIALMDGATPAKKKTVTKEPAKKTMPALAQSREIDAYVATSPEEVREILSRMRETITRAAPAATETMAYGIPTFDLAGEHLVHFAAYKKHIGFYPTQSAMTAFAEEFAPYKTSKGAVQFPLDRKIPYSLIARVVRFRVKEGRGK